MEGWGIRKSSGSGPEFQKTSGTSMRIAVSSTISYRGTGTGQAKVYPRLAPECDYSESWDDEDCGKLSIPSFESAPLDLLIISSKQITA